MDLPKIGNIVNICVPAGIYQVLKRIALKERRSMKQQYVVVLEEYVRAETIRAEKAKYDELVAGGTEQFEAARIVREGDWI